jgi:hypothetical protein
MNTSFLSNDQGNCIINKLTLRHKFIYSMVIKKLNVVISEPVIRCIPDYVK